MHPTQCLGQCEADWSPEPEETRWIWSGYDVCCLTMFQPRLTCQPPLSCCYYCKSEGRSWWARLDPTCTWCTTYPIDYTTSASVVIAINPQSALRSTYSVVCGLPLTTPCYCPQGADPYCVVRVAGDKGRSTICRDTLNPHWDTTVVLYARNPWGKKVHIEVRKLWYTYIMEQQANLHEAWTGTLLNNHIARG